MRTDKEKAFDLRRKGKSYNEIVDELGMSKSTLSVWFKDKDFSNEIKQHLKKRTYEISKKRLAKLNKARGDLLRANYELAKEQALDEINELKNKPLFIAGISLYWGEGDKLSKHQVRLTNTDPKMIKIFTSFLLEICKVDKDKIRLAIFIYPDLDDDTCKKYWSKIAGIHKFHKTQILPSKHKSKRLSYGICTVIVSNSILKTKINVWIDQMSQIVLNKDR